MRKIPFLKIANNHKKRRINRPLIRRLIGIILNHEKHPPLEYLYIVCVNDREILRLNKFYLKHDYVTDVISFDLNEERRSSIDAEIFISLDRAAHQAIEHRVTYSNEVLRLVAHGFLHILGYKDQTRLQREEMLKLGDHYLSLLR